MRALDLKNWFVEQIRCGQFAPDAALPTRHEVMQRFGVARATVDRVIKQLAADGIVYSRHGSGTFVAPLPGESRPHAYVILPGRTAQTGEGFWKELLSGMGGRVGLSLLSFQDVPAAFSSLVQPGTRVAWDCPSLEHFACIASLERAGVPQILLNRRHPAYNYVSTDTAAGVLESLQVLQSRLPEVRLGAVLPPLDPSRPYWSERQIVFYETASLLGLPVCQVERMGVDTHDDAVGAVQRLLEGDGRVNVVFMPEQSHVATFRTIASERSVCLGRDLFVIMTDYVPTVSDAPGVLALEQPFVEMQRQAAGWLLRRTPGRLQRLLPPIVHGKKEFGR